MKPLKKAIALFVLILGIFAFTSKENTIEKANLDLNLENIDVLQLLEEQRLACRPSAEYSFFVETTLKEKLRGANAVEAKVFILENKTGKSNFISSETIIVPKFSGAVHLDHVSNNVTSSKSLINGDKVVNSQTALSLKDLERFEVIKNSYIKSTNELLDLKRSI